MEVKSNYKSVKTCPVGVSIPCQLGQQEKKRKTKLKTNREQKLLNPYSVFAYEW